MIMPVLKILFVTLFGLFGDPAYLWRVGACLLAAAGVLTYWLWPEPLSVWPGVVTLLGAAAIGVVWEWARKDE